jgi:hypothetical protein
VEALVSYSYKAVRVIQAKNSLPVVMFAAPAIEIERWSGVPQKKRLGDDAETVGFQRDLSHKRVESLGSFFADHHNVAANPLLCATRQVVGSIVRFTADSDDDQAVTLGTLSIEHPDYGYLSLEQVFNLVRDYLESRVPRLLSEQPDAALVARLKAQAADAADIEYEGEDLEPDLDENVDDSPEASDESEEEEGPPESGLFEESHITDFWNEIAARHEVLKLLEGAQPTEEFLGFSRTALLSFVKPVVLVDGQHRLAGALKALEKRLSSDDILTEIEDMVIDGFHQTDIEVTLRSRETRLLPVSLILSTDPAEQVFQFVIVNQKATPVGRALLGTIVSTTLSQEEIGKIADRLKSSGVPLEEAQAVTYLARFPGSPFYGLVERGLVADGGDKLQWNVLSSLATMFRELTGARLYGYRNDYAAIWRSGLLDNSAIVDHFMDLGHETPYQYWRSLDGPWRDVFIAFYSAIREKLGVSGVSDAHNAWSSPRTSNLFNKISLTILAADFFQFLHERRRSIDSSTAVSGLVGDWLEGVNPNYFARDWNLAGVKKDSTGIRNQWAFQWTEYRKNPSEKLPQARLYRTPRS